MEHLEQIKNLLFSCKQGNVELAFELAKSQNFDLQGYIRKENFSNFGLNTAEDFIKLGQQTHLSFQGTAPESTDWHFYGEYLFSLSPLDKLFPYLYQVISCNFDYNYFSDLSSLKHLVNLKELHIVRNLHRESKVDFFQYLTQLEILDCSNCELYNLDFVQFMPNLKRLYCWNNYIKTLAPLYSLKNLERLSCGSNPLATEAITTFQAAFPTCEIYAT